MNRWIVLVADALWMLGLAVMLSTLSWAHWRASERKVRFRVIWGTSSCQITCDLGLVLVSVGLSLSARSAWEHVCWALFVLLYAVLALKQWRVWRGKVE